MRGTATSAGAPTARCGSSISSIRTSGRTEPCPRPTSTIGAPVEHLDLATVIKVSQAVSGEIVLEKLIDTLMRTAIEHAGAERGLSDPSARGRAADRGGSHDRRRYGDGASAREPVTRPTLPESVLHYVMRTRESVILDDASAQNPFSADPYIRQRHARSVLCLPLIKQAKLIGVLYLENNLSPSRLHAGSHRGAEAAGLAGGDLAGEYPPVPRSRRTRSEESGAWSTPTSSGSSFATSKVEF